jgi:hypothetical protein
MIITIVKGQVAVVKGQVVGKGALSDSDAICLCMCCIGVQANGLASDHLTKQHKNHGNPNVRSFTDKRGCHL